MNDLAQDIVATSEAWANWKAVELSQRVAKKAERSIARTSKERDSEFEADYLVAVATAKKVWENARAACPLWAAHLAAVEKRGVLILACYEAEVKYWEAVEVSEAGSRARSGR